MRPTRLWRLLPGAALILLSAGSSLAMTLGRAQGVTLIGRPLDITVPVVLDAGNDPTELCPVAEVFYGEARVEGPVVSLRPTGGDSAVIRVQVPRPVDEAFVTVQVRVGCTQMLSRRFVLLTEEPGDTAQAAAQPMPVAPAVIAPPTALPVRPVEPAPSARPQAASSPSAAPAGTTAAAAAPTAAPTPRARPARAAAAERPATAVKRPAPVTRQAAPAPAPAAPSVERPRLKLDAVDLSPNPAPPGQKTSAGVQTSAPGLAAAEAPERGEASTQQQTLSAPSDELVRNAERMVALENDIRAMREGMLKNQAMLAELRGRLEQAEGERYANGLVYALAALLAAACGLAGLFWHRSRRAVAASSSWWADRSQLPEGASPSEAFVPEPQPTAPAITLGGPAQAEEREGLLASPTAPPSSVTPIPRDDQAFAASGGLAEASDDLGARFLPSQSDDLPEVPATAVNLDELNDLQQQVELFVSLGEYERAIGALREHIDAQPQGSAVAWLELLDLYHRLRRESDYEQLRRDYEWVFSHQLPAFSGYVEDAGGIEAHAETLARIQSLWRQPAVLPLIEQAVLRTSRANGESALGLQALRDLLMLHGVASELASPSTPLVPPGRFGARPLMTAEPVLTAGAPLVDAFGADLPAGDASAADSPADAEDAAPPATAPSALGLGALSLDPHPYDEWKKLAPPNSRPAGLDLNLDDLDAPPPSDTAVKAHGGRDHGNLLDFDLDLNDEFKLPKR